MISKYGSTPRLQYGFGGTVNYKKFDFGVFFSGSALRSIMTNGIDPFQEGIAVGNRNVVKYIIIRLKDVEVGYKIPYRLIIFSAANLFTFSPFDLWDPELSSWNSYPMQKTVNVGIQLQF